MAALIPDFTDAEREIVATLVERCFARQVEIVRAVSELRLAPSDGALARCPTLYWIERGAHFVVFKAGDERFRCQFFYTDVDDYGTGRDEYDDLASCVRALLQVQSDHERDTAPGAQRLHRTPVDDIDYHGSSML